MMHKILESASNCCKCDSYVSGVSNNSNISLLNCDNEFEYLLWLLTGAIFSAIVALASSKLIVSTLSTVVVVVLEELLLSFCGGEFSMLSWLVDFVVSRSLLNFFYYAIHYNRLPTFFFFFKSSSSTNLTTAKNRAWALLVL